MMPEKNLDDILSSMQSVAMSAGELMRNSSEEERVNVGNYDDMVTMVDLEADKLIRETLMKEYPDVITLSEETCKFDPGYKPDTLYNFSGFLVDPIDGSVNFSRMITKKYANFAVSIAYCEKGIPLIGVIYKPLEEEMFHAIRGKGAFLNDNPIHVSDVDSFDQASIELGSFWIRTEIELFQRWFTNEETDVNQILIRGSAAAALADVARGRIEAMLHSRLNAWDYAAGWVIIEEAGGVVMDGDTSPLTLGSPFVYGTNKNLHEQIVQIIRDKQGSCETMS